MTLKSSHTAYHLPALLKCLASTNWQVSEESEAPGVHNESKYSTIPCGILINIATKVGIFLEAEGRGKYSLPRVQYY